MSAYDILHGSILANRVISDFTDGKNIYIRSERLYDNYYHMSAIDDVAITSIRAVYPRARYDVMHTTTDIEEDREKDVCFCCWTTYEKIRFDARIAIITFYKE